MDDRKSGPKKKILEAAAYCFTEKGFYASSIDDVAKRLGATKGIIYHHYGSKIELFFDVYRFGMDALLEVVKDEFDRSELPLDRLKRMLQGHIRVMFDYHVFENVVAQAVQIHRYHAMTPVQRASLDVLIASRDRLEDMYKSTVSQGQALGDFDRSVDASIAVKTILGGVHWSLIWYQPNACQDTNARQRLAEQMVLTLVSGLQSRSQERSTRHIACSTNDKKSTCK